MAKAGKKTQEHTTRKQAPSAPSAAALAREAGTIAAPAFALLALLRFAASFFPEERIWGLNHAAFLPDWAAWALLAFAFVLCTPLLYSTFGRAGRALFGSGDITPVIGGKEKAPHIRWIAVAVVAGSCLGLDAGQTRSRQRHYGKGGQG